MISSTLITSAIQTPPPEPNVTMCSKSHIQLCLTSQLKCSALVYNYTGQFSITLQITVHPAVCPGGWPKWETLTALLTSGFHSCLVKAGDLKKKQKWGGDKLRIFSLKLLWTGCLFLPKAFCSADFSPGPDKASVSYTSDLAVVMVPALTRPKELHYLSFMISLHTTSHIFENSTFIKFSSMIQIECAICFLSGPYVTLLTFLLNLQSSLNNLGAKVLQ